MNEKKLDENIQQALLNQTDSMLKHKDEIWNNIERELGLDDSTAKLNKEMNTMTTRKQSIEQNRKQARHKRNKFIGWIIGGVAAASIIGVFTTTNTGQALVANVKQLFEPQKKVVEEYEGMPEEKDIVLQDTESGYIIYIDEERYKLVEEDGQDIIVTKEPLEERYPEVSMSIKQVVDKAPDALAAEITEQLKQQYAEVRDAVEVSDPVNGILISAIDGNKWDSLVSKVYIVSNEQGGSFVITEKYFLEASEGHGARFYYMLKEFKVVEE